MSQTRHGLPHCPPAPILSLGLHLLRGSRPGDLNQGSKRHALGELPEYRFGKARLLIFVLVQ